MAGRPRGAKGPNGKPLTMDDMIEMVEELKARVKILEICEVDLKAGCQILYVATDFIDFRKYLN